MRKNIFLKSIICLIYSIDILILITIWFKDFILWNCFHLTLYRRFYGNKCYTPLIYRLMYYLDYRIGNIYSILERIKRYGFIKNKDLIIIRKRKDKERYNVLDLHFMSFCSYLYYCNYWMLKSSIKWLRSKNAFWFIKDRIRSFFRKYNINN
jgi:hypothetical protein